MSQHTPGPWKFGVYDFCFVEKPFDYRSRDYNDNPGIYGADGTQVVGCDEYYIFSGAADARLIAAAPELLEALEACLEWVDDWAHVISEDGLWVGDADRARAAIKKARGA